MATGGSSEGSIKVFEVATGKQLAEIRTSGGASYTLRFSGDGKNLIASHSDDSLRLYSVDRTGQDRTLEPAIGYIPSYDSSRDGRLVAIPLRSGEIRLYDLTTGETVRTIESKSATFVSFSPNGRWLASSGPDGDLHIWDVDGGKDLRTIPGIAASSRLAWSKQGRTLTVTGQDGTARVFGIKP